jgi:hypothetical protein
MLRLEGAAVFIAAATLYWNFGFSFWIFIAVFLAIDLSMLGYLVSTRMGTITYNLGHHYAIPVAFGMYGILASAETSLMIAIIWFGHIGMDRVVGYGFKFPNDSHQTHIKLLAQTESKSE